MIERVTVEELYSKPGFDLMISEYARWAIRKMPKPLYRKEDYLPLEAAGLLTVWCVMHQGRVVGFASCIVSKIPHYGVAVAITESLFVMEGTRKLGTGLRLIDAIEAHARDLGVPAVFFSCPVGSVFRKILEHRNYSAETTTYVRSLT